MHRNILLELLVGWCYYCVYYVMFDVFQHMSTSLYVTVSSSYIKLFSSCIMIYSPVIAVYKNHKGTKSNIPSTICKIKSDYLAFH